MEDAEGPEFTHFVALQPTAANQTDRGFKKSINALIALAAGQFVVLTYVRPAAQTTGSIHIDCIFGTYQVVAFVKSLLPLMLQYSFACLTTRQVGWLLLLAVWS